MRQRDHARLAEQRRAGEVGHVPAQPGACEALQHRVVGGHALAREVEQHRALVEMLDVLGIDHVPRFLDERHVQAHEVAPLQHLVDRMRAAHLRRQAPRGFHRDVRIVAEHVHAQPYGRVRHQAADLAEADHAERVARKLEAGESLLAALHGLVDVAAVQSLDELERRPEVARRDQHAGEHQLLHGVGVRAGCVEHRDAAFRQCHDRNVVHAGARAANGTQRGPKLVFMQVLRAHQDRPRILRFLDHGIALRREALEAHLRNLVDHQDLALLALSHGAFRIPACTPPAAAGPRSASRCRSRRACRRPSGGP